MKQYHVTMIQMTKMEVDVWAKSDGEAEVAASRAIVDRGHIQAIVNSPEVVAIARV